MAKTGAKTREKIIDSAQALVYRHGFAATTVDKVIEGAGVTKGAFFYHFKTKADLGRTLIARYAERDLAHLDRTIGRAEKLSGDPRHQVSIFIGLLQEDVEALPDPIPGCLFTSYLYERAEYPDDVAEITVRTFEQWTGRVAEKIEQAAEVGGLDGSETPQGLATTLLATIEGGFVLAKARGDGSVLTDLLGQFRARLEGLLGIRV